MNRKHVQETNAQQVEVAKYRNYVEENFISHLVDDLQITLQFKAKG